MEELKDNKSEAHLSLSSKGIDNRIVQCICEGLKVNATVTELNLGNIKSFYLFIIDNNRIGDKGAVSIAQCLKKNKALTKLQLEKNQIGDEGACAIAEAIKVNKKLKEIYLCN